MDDEQKRRLPDEIREAFEMLEGEFKVSNEPQVAIIEHGPKRMVTNAIVGVGKFNVLPSEDGDIPDELDGKTFDSICVRFTTLDNEEHWFLLNPDNAPRLAAQLVMTSIEHASGPTGPIAELLEQMKELDNE